MIIGTDRETHVQIEITMFELYLFIYFYEMFEMIR